ncbi:MAG: DMT family transporter [bacterium]
MIGEVLALLTALMWSASVIFFSYAGRNISAVNLNLIRLVLASIFLGVTLSVMAYSPFPKGANLEAWLWLGGSGLLGLALGDYFMFMSYQIIPPRITQLIMTLGPPFAALFGYLILGETLTLYCALGMVFTLSGISLSILSKNSGDNQGSSEELNDGQKKKAFKVKQDLPIKGLLCALVAAFCQGVGLVLSKQGMVAYEANLLTDASFTPPNQFYISLASTQARNICAMVCFILLVTFNGGWKSLFASFSERKHLGFLSLGAVVGPFVGVSFSLMALQFTSAAVTSTILALIPVILILPDRFIFHKKVTFAEVVGACISVFGVSMFFW